MVRSFGARGGGAAEAAVDAAGCGLVHDAVELGGVEADVVDHEDDLAGAGKVGGVEWRSGKP